MDFVFYAENQDGHQNGGKLFLEKVTNTLCRYSWGQKFRLNRRMSHRF